MLTDPSYAGQAVVMTYPLIGNYGICNQDKEAKKSNTDAFIVRELARLGSNFRKEESIQQFLVEQDIHQTTQRKRNNEWHDYHRKT